jgi:hypothetical protein
MSFHNFILFITHYITMTASSLDPTSTSLVQLLSTFTKGDTLVFYYPATDSSIGMNNGNFNNFNLPNDKNIVMCFYNAYVPGSVNLSVKTYDPSVTPTDPSNQFAVLKNDDRTTAELVGIIYALSSGSARYMAIIHPTTTVNPVFDSRLQVTTSSTGGVTLIGTDTTMGPLMTPDGFGLVIVISKGSPLISISLSRSNYIQSICQTNCGSVLSANTTYSPFLFWVCNGIWLFVLIIILLVCSLSYRGGGTGSEKKLFK